MMHTAIKVTSLSKTFISQSGGHKIVALENLSLEVNHGEILGVLGPNGAGKTTLLNVLSTLLLPDCGEIEILGIKLTTQNYYHLRQILNMSSGHPNFPWSLTVEENLKFYGMLYGLSGKVLREKIDQLVEMFHLKEHARKRFDELSSGTKQRLSLAKALLNDPQIIFLDEPTVGLDPDVAVKTRKIIKDIHKRLKATTILTTHNMHEAEMMCERIAFIKQGKILQVATPQQLKDTLRKKDLEEVFIELAQRKIEMAAENIPHSSKEMMTIEKKSPENFSKSISLWLTRCLSFTYRNFLFALRNLFSFMELIFWPIVTLLSIGLLGDYLRLKENAFSFIMTGAIASGVLQVTQLDVAYSLLYEVWSKSVKHTFLTPIGTSEYLFGSWFVGILRGLIIFCVLSLAAILFFGFHFPSMGSMLIFLLGIFGNALILGMIVNVLILIYGQKAEITAWMFAYVFMLVCGIYYPIDTLPKVFYTIAQFIPMTYFLEYFRRSFGFEPLLNYSLIKGFGLIAVYLVMGLKIMQYAFYQARKNGVIVRLSE